MVRQEWMRVNLKIIQTKSFNIMDSEIWKPIQVQGFEGLYLISNLGNVWSVRKNKNLKHGINGGGYKFVVLYNHGKAKIVRIHRILAEYFIPNPNNYPCVNHKDENKLNNSLDNLEWCTAEYNSNYGTCKERIGLTNGIPVLKYDLEGNFISEYPTMTEAERNEGIDHANICICCEGKISHCNNFIWIYKGDEHTIQDRIKKVKNSITRPKKLEMYDRDGQLIRTYDSILQASKTSGDSYMIINRQLKTGIITKNAIHIWKQV